MKTTAHSIHTVWARSRMCARVWAPSPARSISPSDGPTDLPHCTFTSSTYTNSLDPGLQTLGRQILAASDAIVLIPQQPLVHGLSYTVSVVVNDQTLVWTFQVAP